MHPSSVQQRHRRHAQTKKGANIKPNSGRKHKTSHWWALNPLRRKARRGCDENFCWGSCYFPINHQQSGRHLPRCVRFPLRTSISRCPRLSPFFVWHVSLVVGESTSSGKLCYPCSQLWHMPCASFFHVCRLPCPSFPVAPAPKRCRRCLM